MSKDQLSAAHQQQAAGKTAADDTAEDVSNPIYLTAAVALSQQDEASQASVPERAAAEVPPSEDLPDIADIIFRSYDIRGIVGECLTPEVAELIGRAVASEALAQGETALLIGYDARTHSPELCQHLQQGVLATGCDVLDIGLVPTPLLNFAAVFSEQTGSGIVVTASHNPKSYNGFKMIIKERSLVADDIQGIKQRIDNNDLVKACSPGVLTKHNFADDYIETVIADIAITAGLRVVVDAANGAASELAPALLNELGCEVFPLYCEFDGEFPHHDPDPSVPANLQPLIDAVVDNKADLGIALDGDGDRLVAISPSGKIIWPDQLLMLFAKDVVARHPGCDVVYDVKSTRHLNQLIVSYGGRPVMWKTGHSHMKAKMHNTAALLAGEFSGHIFFKERWFGFDDGLYAAARLLEIISLRDQNIDEMLTVMPAVISTPEYKVAIDETKKFAFMTQLIAEGDFESGEKILIDGLRIEFPKGWGLVRASNTSPALTLRFEADDEASLLQLKKLFKREISKIDNQLLLEF
ncbi:MAG: phosphomannomutase/phosphoglucomutase [Cellvibrionaceae bacterium]|nr:phosphomannomutase/phosphoglucomutase [Cellvibrionaceae bacterium]